mmetsp:Transcript_7936/g.18339  ORF Transcript_7936/g.18339 Transcript_7936/m.18339 type:complete len:563 (-) Transcript_7936:74-1762(-)
MPALHLKRGGNVEEPPPPVGREGGAEGLLARNRGPVDGGAPRLDDLGDCKEGEGHHREAAVDLLARLRDANVHPAPVGRLLVPLVQVERLAHAQGGLVEGVDRQVGEGVDEVGLAVERRDPLEVLDACLLGHLAVLLVNLLERLHVVRHKGEGHDDNVLQTVLAELVEHRVRVGLEPLDGAHPALEAQCVVKLVSPLPVDLLHNQLRAPLNLRLVRVPRLHVRHGHAVRREHDLDVAGAALELLELLLDELCLRLDIPGVVKPVGHHRVVKPAGVPGVGVRLDHLVEEAERRARRGDRVLGVEGDDDEAADLVLEDLVNSLLGEGKPVAHPNIDLGFQPPLLKLRLKLLALIHREIDDGRAPPDRLVRLHGARGARGGDPAGDEALKGLEGVGETDDVGVVEEVEEKVLDLVELLGTAEIQKEDPHLLLPSLCLLGGLAVDRRRHLAEHVLEHTPTLGRSRRHHGPNVPPPGRGEVGGAEPGAGRSTQGGGGKGLSGGGEGRQHAEGRQGAVLSEHCGERAANRRVASWRKGAVTEPGLDNRSFGCLPRLVSPAEPASRTGP